MASTIATLQGYLATRLKIGTEAGAPSSATQSIYLRQAFMHVIGILPPIKMAETTLTSDTGDIIVYADLTSSSVDDIYYVGHNERCLIRGIEWNLQAGVLYVTRSAGQPGEKVGYYYLPTITIVPASTTTVETTCIFGQNWLEEPALLYAEMLALNDLSGVSSSNSGPSHAQHYRAVEETYNSAMSARAQVWNSRMEQFRQAEALRLQLGDLPLVEHRYAKMKTGGKIVNRLFPLVGGRR